MASDTPGLPATVLDVFAGERLSVGLPQTCPDCSSVPGGQGFHADLLTDMMTRMNNWMDRLPTWQFVLVWACALVLSFAAVAGISQWTSGNLSLPFLLGYGVVYILLSTTAAAWSRQRRHRRAENRAARKLPVQHGDTPVPPTGTDDQRPSTLNDLLG
jgi:hypothetical protein